MHLENPHGSPAKKGGAGPDDTPAGGRATTRGRGRRPRPQVATPNAGTSPPPRGIRSRGSLLVRMPPAHHVSEGHTRHRSKRVSCAVSGHYPNRRGSRDRGYHGGTATPFRGPQPPPSQRNSPTSWCSGRGYRSGTATPFRGPQPLPSQRPLPRAATSSTTGTAVLMTPTYLVVTVHYRYGGPTDPNLSSSDGPAKGTAVRMTPNLLSLEQLARLAQWYGGPTPRTPTIA